MLLDPDPHSQYGSGSKTAKGMRIQAGIRIRIRNTGIYYRRLSPWVFYVITYQNRYRIEFMSTQGIRIHAPDQELGALTKWLASQALVVSLGRLLYKAPSRSALVLHLGIENYRLLWRRTSDMPSCFAE